MEKPVKNTLTKADWEKWTRETIVYTVVPIVLIFIQTLQSAFFAHHGLPNGNDLLLAAGAAYGTLLASLINLLGKYKARE